MGVLVADATVLIDGINGVPAAVGYLTPLRLRGVLAVHPVAYCEVLEGAKNNRMMQEFDRGLGELILLRVKGDDHTMALALLKQHFLSTSAGAADCLIAATCLRLGLPLVTTNVKHFRLIRGLKVVRPY